MERDFKGVWIPKEIWLNKELSALDKCIFAEIDSLDNENHCTATNEYLAEFCGCSERKVSEAISKLMELGYLEQVSFDGRCRVLRVAKIAMQGSKNCYADSQKPLSSNNIYNNIDNKNTNRITRSSINTTTPNFGYADNTTTEDILEDTKKEDKDIVESHAYSQEDLKREFLGSAKKNRHTKAYTRKQSLYEQCSDAVTAYTKNIALQDALLSYLSVRLANKDKPMYGVNQWKGMLNKLSEVSGESFFDKSVEKRLEIVNRSIEHGWLSFYELKSKNGGPAGELGEVQCRKSVDEEILDEKY